jgi:chitin biosynthesis protein CHS5
MPEEQPEEPVSLDDEREGSSPVATKHNPSGRRREGTMNKNFKFPRPGDPAPPVPGLPRDNQDHPDPNQRLSSSVRTSASNSHQGSEQEEMATVGVVAPSSVEVPPPPPVEKERNNVSGNDDLEDVGETEEISLN